MAKKPTKLEKKQASFDKYNKIFTEHTGSWINIYTQSLVDFEKSIKYLKSKGFKWNMENKLWRLPVDGDVDLNCWIETFFNREFWDVNLEIIEHGEFTAVKLSGNGLIDYNNVRIKNSIENLIYSL